MSQEWIVVLMTLAPLVGAMQNGLLGGRLPRPLVWVNALGAATLSFGLAAFLIGALGPTRPEIRAELFTWLASGSVEVSAALVFDKLSATMALLITGIASLIQLYAIGWDVPAAERRRVGAVVNLMCFAMLVLVLGGSLALVFVGWQGITIGMTLLDVASEKRERHSVFDAKTFLVHRVGDFGFLLAMMILLRFAGTLSFDSLSDAVQAGRISVALANAAALLLVLAATSRSGQLPWLLGTPGSASLPVPAFAFVHGVTVTSGLYLLVRLGFLLERAPVGQTSLALIGGFTAFLAATSAAAQNDFRRILAYAAASQLGFAYAATGFGFAGTGLFHAVVHALAQAALCLGGGLIQPATRNESDRNSFGGVRPRVHWLYAAFLLAVLVLMILPLGGVLARIERGALWNAPDGFAIALSVAATGVTSFYLWRFVFLVSGSGELSPEAGRRSGTLSSASVVALAALAPTVFALGWSVDSWATRLRAPTMSFASRPRLVSELEASFWILTPVAIGIPLLGFSVAWLLFGRGVSPLATRLATEGSWSWLYTRLLRGWHLEGLYRTIFVEPLVWASRLLRAIDRIAIDGLVNGFGRLVAGIGFLPQVLQSGSVQRYLAIFAIAVAALLFGWLAPGDSNSSGGSKPEMPIERGRP